VRLAIAAALALGAVALPAQAQIKPEPGSGDPRMQSVLYDPDQVVQLQVAPNYQLSVEFSADERIENIALGDTNAWEVTPNKRGDRLFIRALQGGSPTNLTVVTDAHSYSFELAPGYGALMPFTVRFRYPPAAVATVAEAPPVPAGRYRLSGDRVLRPNAIRDDGMRTFISWNADKAMPAVFALDGLGKEVAVDGQVRGGEYVIDDVKNNLLFRLGNQQASARRQPQRKVR
jgi:type IV secretion system protein VirB9